MHANRAMFFFSKKPYIANAKPISCPSQMHDQISQARICMRMIAKSSGEKTTKNKNKAPFTFSYENISHIICMRMIAKKLERKTTKINIRSKEQGNSILRCKEIWRKRSRTHLNDILLIHNLIGFEV